MPVRRGERFTYERVDVCAATGTITSHFALDGRRFQEVVELPVDLDWEAPGLAGAVRLLFLLSGVSYYKTAAPPLIDLGTTPACDEDVAFLREFYREGLGEFGYVNDISLDDLEITGGGRNLPEPAPATPRPERALIPFGGGIDSVVVVEEVKRRVPDSSLFIAGRFAPIEASAAVTGLPILRAARRIDPQVLRSADHGFLNGHVPVTGILSAIAVTAAVLAGRTSVVMSNERSASSPTVEVGGRGINHQYSKSHQFERGFRRMLSSSVPGVRYFSALRPYSELWVARRFADLTQYHAVFRSCNQAFHVDPARRSDSWCGECDKCCFNDLILAPFMSAAQLRAVFTGREPLDRPELMNRFRRLLGDSALAKPFECVGDVGECRAAVLMATDRVDRADNPVLPALRAQVLAQGEAPSPGSLLSGLGDHFIDESYAIADSLV